LGCGGVEMGERKERVVDADKVTELNNRARILMSEPEFYENGYVLKCFLEELGLWEEKNNRIEERR
jgi:hypothetical protein